MRTVRLGSTRDGDGESQTYPQVLVNVISGGLTPSFTTQEAEEMGAKVISQFGMISTWNGTSH